MSRDPQRLLSATSDADELERELLSSVRDAAPPPGAHVRVWSGLSAQIAAATVASAAQATTSFTLSKALAAKLVLGLALGGAAAGAGSAWLGAQDVPVRPLVTGASALSRAARSSAPAAATAPEPPPAPVAAAAPATSAAAAPPKTDDERLRAESQLLARARAQLRQGDSAAAHATLRRLQARFPRGLLRQEREVLAIEILSAQGKAAASERRARAFIEAHPESPHSTNLRRFTAAP